jgi:energy-coupling factor transport system permease protein
VSAPTTQLAPRATGAATGRRVTSSRLPRPLHPAAWWLWALGLAAAASRTTNPLLLVLAVAVAALVVAARRTDSPWARAFRLYLLLGAVIVVLRVVLHVAVGFKYGDHLLVRLPEAELPSWAAGIQLGGPLYAEGLLGAAYEGLRIAALIACIGAANALANPKRLLRALPGALHDIGVAVVVAITVAPQLAESVLRVRRARRLRGDGGRGPRSALRIALPVLQDALDRSLSLAAAMDSRGYGRIGEVTTRTRRTTAALVLGGLLGTCLGTYGLLDAASPAALGAPTLAAGLVLAAAGLWLGGRRSRRTAYRPDPWWAAEWAVAGLGLVALLAVVVGGALDPASLTAPLQPLAVPALPLLPVLGLLAAALPAVVAPEPPSASAPTTRDAR